MTDIMQSQIEQLEAAETAALDAASRLRAVLDALEEQEPEWVYPVGSLEYPTEDWYCACWHDTTGKRNGGYAHTGIDLNVDHYPWGDIDRGQPVWAIADGTVHAVGYHASYLGGIVIETEHQGAPLYVRYWHLANDATFQQWRPGMTVQVDDIVGHIGNYTLGAGGDHLHFDMALDPFQPQWWFTSHRDVRWIDPVPVLREHLDPALVGAMLERGKAYYW